MEGSILCILICILILNTTFQCLKKVLFLPRTLCCSLLPVKARGSSRQLLGFHQAAFHLQPGVRQHRSTHSHQQGSAVPC